VAGEEWLSGPLANPSGSWHGSSHAPERQACMLLVQTQPGLVDKSTLALAAASLTRCHCLLSLSPGALVGVSVRHPDGRHSCWIGIHRAGLVRRGEAGGVMIAVPKQRNKLPQGGNREQHTPFLGGLATHDSQLTTPQITNNTHRGTNVASTAYYPITVLPLILDRGEESRESEESRVQGTGPGLSTGRSRAPCKQRVARERERKKHASVCHCRY
jgi:hypothetical protein